MNSDEGRMAVRAPMRGCVFSLEWVPMVETPRLKTIKAASRQLCHNHMMYLGKPGAGEGIRTLDPNLGKVVLYP